MKHVLIGAHLTPEDIGTLAVALPTGPVTLSAIAVDDDRPLSDRQLLLETARVRAKLTERATFVAIRYGVSVATAGEAAEKCAARLEQWRALLERHREEVELTMKIAAAGAGARPVRGDYSSGADYLRALQASTGAATVDPAFREAAGAMFEDLGGVVRWSVRDNSSRELAVLLLRSRLDEVAPRAEELKRRFPHVPFLLSGPWPLEVFADADHE